MHALQMIALGFVDYDSPELSNETRKKLRSDLRKALAAYDLDLIMYRQKRVEGRGTDKRVFWTVAGFELAGEIGTPARLQFRKLNDLCKHAYEIVKQKAGEDLDTLAG